MCEVVNLKNSEYSVYIGRGKDGASHCGNTDPHEDGWLGNPFPEYEYGREKCIEMFRYGFEKKLQEDEAFRRAVKELEGETLGCYCKPRACHGEVIAEWVAKLNR